jgi:AraC-like DNA-binding protein
MSRLFDLIESRIDDSTLSINKVASALHVSKMQLYRRVKRSSKLSPNQFIRAIRLQKGRQLLLTTDWNIAEIAYAVGFNDPNYFSRSFTREFKRSPSRYRSEEFKTNSTPV